MTNIFRDINYNDFHFLRPEFLWLLIPIVFIFLIGMFLLRENIQWKTIIAPHLRSSMIKKGSFLKRLMMHISLFITITLAIVGLSGPTWKLIELPAKVLETPLIIVLDLSQSMMAEDIQPNRLERAKFKINDLIEFNPQARIALIGFAGTAHTIIPLTRDYKIINSHVKSLSPNVMPFTGSDLEAAIKLADTLTSVTKAPGTILIFSDDFNDSHFQLLKEYAIKGKNRIVIVPMNTPNGARIPHPYYSKRHLKDKSGKFVKSQLNTTILNKLNSIEGINIIQLTLDDSDMELLSKDISKHLEFTEKKQAKEDDWEDYGLWFIIPFIILVLFWHRKGWVLFSLVFIISFSSCNKVNEIKKKTNKIDQKIKETTFKDLWFTRDYQAQKMENNDNLEQAAQTYNSNLRSGIAWYKSGDYEKAIEKFEKDTSVLSTYNLAIAYYKNGDYAAAAMNFSIVSESSSDLKQQAQQNQLIVQKIIDGQEQVNPDDIPEAPIEQEAKNLENKDMEDLGGGGQEAKKEDMKQERKEETVSTDVRKGKEMEELPDDFESGKPNDSQKVLMRKVDDDPALFLKRKFKHQVKVNNIKPRKGLDNW